MEKGNLRADVNVSVRRPGEPLGTRCEIKNVNSIRFIGQAIEVEARRQIAIIEDGGEIDQETRLFDPARGETRSMRSKEEAHDYRYFPDPDLLPLEFDEAFVDALAARSARSCPTPRRRASSPTTGCRAYDAVDPRRGHGDRRFLRERGRRTAARSATPRRSPTGSWATSPRYANADGVAVAEAGLSAGALATPRRSHRRGRDLRQDRQGRARACCSATTRAPIRASSSRRAA